MYHCLKLLHPTLHLLKCMLVCDIVNLHPCLPSGVNAGFNMQLLTEISL